MDLVKTETDARIDANVVGESTTPAMENTSLILACGPGAVKKRQASAELENARQRDKVVVRRMLSFTSAVAVVALVAAIAALFLAITAMKSRNDSTAKVQGKDD